MKTVEIKSYQYDELSEDAQERALEQMAEINVDDYEWWDCTVEGFNGQMQDYGIDGKDLCFDSGRGRYAYWSDAVVSPETLFDKLNGEGWHIDRRRRFVQAIQEYLGISTQPWYNHHKNMFDWSVYDYFGMFPDVTSEVAEADEREALKLLEDLCEWLADKFHSLLRELDNEYDHQCSSEAVEDTIRANEYSFTEDGSRKVYL